MSMPRALTLRPLRDRNRWPRAKPTEKRRRGTATALVLGFGGHVLLMSSSASAQTELITPAINPDYNRDRNISVQERPHPDYDQLGIRVGSFVVRPSLTLNAVTTSNVYLDDTNKKGDIYANLLPFLAVDSDWSVHRFSLVAAGDLRRYARTVLKNQNAWYVYGHGQLDVHSDLNLQADAQIDKSVESPYFGDVIANLTVPSSYLRTMGAIKASYAAGRSRFSLATDISRFAFNAVRFGDGRTRDQRSRNRSVYRAAGIYEFALSPSVAVYAQANADLTKYEVPQTNGSPNRDSNEFAISIGTNFDLARMARGSIGIGYSRRHYDVTRLYPTAQGISAQAKVDLFPSELYTIKIVAQRQLEDVNLANGGAFWNNLVSIGVDHEITDNAIMSASVEAIRRDYLELRSHSEVYQARLSGTYQLSRQVGINVDLSYGSNRPVGSNLGNPFHEISSTIGIRIRD